MNEQEILASANSRIDKIRKCNVTITVISPDGKPLPGARVEVEQTRHEFLFGCNCFPLLKERDERWQTYAREFSDLLNYATLPFYWGAYEPERGKPVAEDRLAVAQWCKEQGIATKGHPLVWHEVYPSWGPSDPDEARALLKARVMDIVPRFEGLVDRWDVVNEATVAHKFDNAVTKWVKRDGEFAMVAESLDWAREAGAGAFLLYNDYNTSPEYEKLAGELVGTGKPVDAFGIQSHMHGGEWPIENVWNVCETYAGFGKPLHFTELTVISGENGWAKEAPWPTTPQFEERQAAYVEKLYTTLFSHPAVEAITWWDFEDGAWMGAPAGLVRADLTPKPVYGRLLGLIKGKWWSRVGGSTNTDGKMFSRCYFGSYKVSVTAGGSKKVVDFELKRGENRWTIRL